jgi:glycosyltransferase involved in cell wall biosynthesis
MISRPIKVLHVYKTYYPDSLGGIEQVIQQLGDATGQLGIENRVFTMSRQAKEQPSFQSGGIPVIRAPIALEMASTPMSVKAFSTFRAAAAQADVLHYHYPWPFADLLHLAAGGGKPSLVTYHSDIVKQRMLMPLYNPLMRRFFSQLTAIVPTSPNYLESSELLQDYRTKAVVIPIGLDPGSRKVPTADRLEKWRATAGENFFLFIGVLRYYKGLHILLDACADIRARVVIVGAGPEEARLKAQAARLNLTNVQFAGAVSDEDKWALLQLCRAVVFPSHLRSEAFGVTLLEGAMAAKPLISAEIGTGSSYVNQDGVTGFVVPSNDPAALRAAMQRMDDDQTASVLGRNARQRYEDLFTSRKMGRSYADLYRKMMGEEVA